MMFATQQHVETGIKRLVKGKSPVEDDTKTNGQVSELMSRWINKKVLQEDVLYLVVVNLPSQEKVKELVAKLKSIMKDCGCTYSVDDIDHIWYKFDGFNNASRSPWTQFHLHDHPDPQNKRFFLLAPNPFCPGYAHHFSQSEYSTHLHPEEI
jgi:hypothetical protein